MIRYGGTVVFSDGRRQSFEAGMRAARAWEAYAARHGMPMNATPDTVAGFPVHTWQLVISHAALGVEQGLEAWAADVEGVEDWTAAEVPPTRAAPSAVA